MFVPSKSLPLTEISFKPNVTSSSMAPLQKTNPQADMNLPPFGSTESRNSIAPMPPTVTSVFSKVESESKSVPSTTSLFSKNEAPNAPSTTSIFQAPNTNTASLPMFSSATTTAATNAWFKEGSTPITTPAPTPVFSFSNNAPNTATETPKFNFTFGAAKKSEESSLFANTFSGSSNINNTNMFGLGSDVGKNNMPAPNPISGNGLLGNSVLGGNVLSGTPDNANVPNNSGASIFGKPADNVANMWPQNNQSSNIFSTVASTNTIQKPAAFTFGASNTFNSTFGSSGNNSVGAFGSSAPQQQNIFGISNSNGNNAPSPFSSQQPSTEPTATGLFGQPNVGASPFGAPTQTVPAFVANPTATPAFNFGSQQPIYVIGLGQQQNQQSVVYNFGGATAAPQFAVGTSQSNSPTAVRRIRKALHHTTCTTST
ncbi:unnamed protein product [Leptidea sinapis]|uniref:Uncharacterized protein n=1 Tax=Leptidea sinapis TaxID=189913 RepID=A0A5E4QCK6_9NEOP|nr:unnamed protein product [Leptidea sinapis]